MTDTTLIADLIRAGLDADLVGRVANAIAGATANSTGIPVDKTAEKRRAWDRERKRNSTGIPPDSTGNENSALYIKNLNKKDKKQGFVCPVEFSPSESHYEAGLKFGFGREAVDTLCAEMRAWSLANSNRAVSRKSDWGQAFHGWISRQAKDRKTNARAPANITIGEQIEGWEWDGSKWKRLEAAE